jgi:PPE-repeat protein
VVAQGEIPEITSSEFWDGPSAASFFSSAAQLEALASAIIAMLGGHGAVEAALAASWPAPVGELSVLANVPHMLWLAKAAGLLSEAAAQITSTGETFELMRAATATPVAVFENQGEHMALQGANFMGMLTPWIVANRARYGEMWVRGVVNKNGYQAASAAGVQAIPEMDPPPPTAAPLTGAAAGIPAEAAPAAEAMSTGGAPLEMLQSIVPQMTQLPAQAGQLLNGGGGLQSLTQLPQQAMGQLSSMSSQFGAFQPGSALDAVGGIGAADWASATPLAGGPVAASLSGVSGSGGMVGAGTAALRSPVSWSSTVNAAAPNAAEATQVSRLAEARAATSAPASTSGMGGSGAMMGPMAHGASGAASSTGSDKREPDDDGAVAHRRGSVLSAAATAFRGSDGLPTITGSGGALYVAPVKEGAS